jgi:glycosyltransferase involved in cell wall biosynthesis
MSPLHVAIVCDFQEENWPSMNLVADMLLQHLDRDHASAVVATRICPPMHRRFTREETMSGKLFNADRLLNRFWDYPHLPSLKRPEFDLFHIIDHSYGQLVHQLPSERTVITCHDLDTFRCLLNGSAERRSLLFRSITRRVMSGLGKAARVTCVSVATRDELLRYEVVAPERIVVIQNGVHPDCSAQVDPIADEEAARLLGPSGDEKVEILHVGSTIPRKRIDILLRVFATLRKEVPQVQLIRVGGPFSAPQMAQLEQLRLTGSAIVLPYLEKKVLAAVYRRAALVLQPSEREGFGLPVIEAMACGTPVVASDLPVLREVGGDAACYCPVGDVPAWSETIGNLLGEREQQPEEWAARRAAGIAQASKFSWAEYARKMVGLYQQILTSEEGSWKTEVRRQESEAEFFPRACRNHSD